MKTKQNYLYGVFTVFLVLAFAGCSGLEDPPALKGTVNISGNQQVGQTLTADIGNLGGSGEISYQWKRGNVDISGATGSSYTVQSADVGSTITVTVTRSGNSGSITSDPTAIIVNISLPTPGLAFNLINNGMAYSVGGDGVIAPVVIIPDFYNELPVIEINEDGFSENTYITSIVIPDSVTKIGHGAFRGCTSLTWIDEAAFHGCTGLTTVFYGGVNLAAWNEITIDEFGNLLLASAIRYYYSETNPGTANTHWRWVEGVPTVWE